MTTKRKRSSNFYSEDIEKEIARLYVEEGLSCIQLQEMFGYKTRKSITDKVKRFYPNYDFKNRKTTSTPYYGLSFEIIDTPYKAYFIGLLITDGYVQSKRPAIGIDLIDKDCIEFIAKQYNFNVSTYDISHSNNQRHRIVFEGKQYVEQLQRFSIVPQKSLIVKPPILLPQEEIYLPYIIRGMIDGDGSIHDRCDGKPTINFCSASYELISWFKTTLEQKLFLIDIGKIHIRKAEDTENGNVDMYYLAFSQPRQIELIKTLCYYEPFGMARKRNKLFNKLPETTIGIVEK